MLASLAEVPPGWDVLLVRRSWYRGSSCRRVRRLAPCLPRLVAPIRVCCDAALFDARQMKWTAIEPTPFARCAHSAVILPVTSAGAAEDQWPGKRAPRAMGFGDDGTVGWFLLRRQTHFRQIHARATV
jgi:hypothetical protein